MNKSNILVTTLGNVYALVPELLGFTNPKQVPLYKFHSDAQIFLKLRKDCNIEPVKYVWLITTNGNNAVTKVLEWVKTLKHPPEIKFFILKGHNDLTSAQEIKLMTELIYRVVAHAHEFSHGGQVVLSLAGGRKTMSADMQQAGHLFGCHALLHVTDNAKYSRNNFFKTFRFDEPVPKPLADAFLPVVISGRLNRNAILDFPPSILAKDYPLNINETINYIQTDTSFTGRIFERLADARNLLFNFSISLSSNYKQTNYRALYALPPNQINDLQNKVIGKIPQNAELDKSFLRKLPKAELHCHLGGILTAKEMIEVADSNKREIDLWRAKNPDFKQWIHKISIMINQRDLNALHREIPDMKELRDKFPAVPKPLTVAAFLSLFNNKVNLLDRFIFGEYLDDNHFRGIGIDKYETLGDLQGSALLQSEASLRAACRVLIRKCQEENVRYLELRQSPVKYTQGGLNARQVVKIIREELASAKGIIFKAVFITSRHNKMSEAHQHIELAQALFNTDPSYRDWIVGFDLAGAEHARTPAQMRDAFLPLMEESMNITIHAGETESVKNIWEAVYYLNADRIGHGLTLNNDKKLKMRFLNRKITVEMCPSSNDQIVGYGDTAGTYPLKNYLTEGLRVTVNTDNPGISRTTFSNEYYKAAELSKEGLTIWEILQIIRNGFRGAFLPFEERHSLLLKSEQEIMEVLKGCNIV